MLKVSIFIFSLVASVSATAQNAIVIDNTKDYQSIFDSNDPFSFVSLVQSNAYYLGYMEIEGMSEKVYDKLSSSEKKNVSEFIGQPGTEPLLDADPNSPRFGNALIVANPTTGQQSFVYAAPDTVYTMLNPIDRIVIELKDGEGSAWERATTVSYFKQLDGVYHSVLRVNAQDLLSFDGFSYCRPLDDKFTDELVSDAPNSMWTAMRTEALQQKEMYNGSKFGKWRYDLKQHYFPADAILFGFFNWGDGPMKIGQWEANRDVYYASLSDEAQEAQFPFGLNLGSGIVADTTGRANLLSTFKEVFSDHEISVKPLKDKDPYSPNFGKELVIENADGSSSFQYPAPKEVFFWIEYSPEKIYAKESFHSAGNASETSLDGIYFTINVNGQEEVISTVPCNEAIQKYFSDHKTLSIDEVDFYKSLNKAFENKKMVFDLGDAAARSKLDME